MLAIISEVPMTLKSGRFARNICIFRGRRHPPFTIIDGFAAKFCYAKAGQDMIVREFSCLKAAVNMCGIAGGLRFASDNRGVSREVVSRLNALQRQRGPDGDGLWASADNRIVLGHRRLAIIDTGASGAQPMQDATRRWVISFNGEIYNYAALRCELETLGRKFETNSDTEVLINAIAEWGEAGLLRLRGMYAFALWDSLHQELWLARDPYGIKPLYFSDHEGTLWFASQARPLASCAPVNTRQDTAALCGFYLWGYVPEPFSWWQGIKMFPAGHVQRIKACGELTAPRPFARIQDAYVGLPQEPLVEGELRGLMLDTIQHHMVSDVGVGIFLSAGIDSSVIAALASEVSSKLCTVTVAFNEYAGTPQDEAPLAEVTARMLGTEHHTVRVGRDEFEDLRDGFMRSMDQPTTDGFNTYLVSHAASKLGLKVALSGLGADELFGGYRSFRQIPKLLYWGRSVSSCPGLANAVQNIFRKWAPSAVPPKVAGLLTHCGDVCSAYLLRRALYLEDELHALLDEKSLSEGLEKLATEATLSGSIPPSSTYSQISVLESCWYMRNQLLRDTDWSSMAHGLEVRVPFLDSRLLARIGPAIASKSPPTKQDLAVCARQLPASVLARPKTGFTTPVGAWASQSVGKSSPRGLRGWAGHVHQQFQS
jgi:asparagine synthase (glutamine-hydrolysing)